MTYPHLRYVNITLPLWLKHCCATSLSVHLRCILCSWIAWNYCLGLRYSFHKTVLNWLVCEMWVVYPILGFWSFVLHKIAVFLLVVREFYAWWCSILCPVVKSKHCTISWHVVSYNPMCTRQPNWNMAASYFICYITILGISRLSFCISKEMNIACAFHQMRRSNSSILKLKLWVA